MIIAYIVFFALGIVAFFLMAKFGMSIRLVAALGLFLIPSIVLTMWVARIGDKAPPDAVTIVPKHSEISDPTDSNYGDTASVSRPLSSVSPSHELERRGISVG